MIAWTFKVSSEFDDSRSQWIAAFQSEVARYSAKPSGQKARDLDSRLKAFNHFLKTVNQLHDKKIRPEDHLAFVQNDDQKKPIYSLICENWRCLYLVDEVARTCIAIRIEPMSDSLRNVEEDRHKNGKKPGPGR